VYYDKLKEMYELQNKLNILTIKKIAWQDGYSLAGMRLNWFRYIKMEASELIESFPIKHWKDIDKKINFLNSKIELVDIWHFLLSKIIETDLINMKKKAVSLYELEEIFESSYKKYEELKIVENNHIKYCEKFEIYLNEFEYYVSTDSIKGVLSIDTLDTFIKLCCSIGLSFEELHKIYIGKNCLNQFRQDNGYKENTDIKTWENKEDNEVMFEIVDELEIVNYTILYNKLEETYKKVC
jgi:dimeric dUTPase (all-alpha-NTP-PPase superfamily)